MTSRNRVSHETSPATRRTASEWLARRTGGFSPEEEGEFARWLAADPQHQSAFAEIDCAWAVLNAPARSGNSESLRRGIAAAAGRRAIRRRRYLIGSLSLAAAAVLVLTFVLPRRSAEPIPERRSTVAVRPDKRTLPDGSIVELNAGAEIAIEFLPGRRGVRLVRGEAHFEVTKDITRPFVVSAGSIEVKAVGTEFAVRFDPKQVDVLVTEGRVAVNRVPPDAAASSIPPPEPVYLDAGGRLELPAELPLVQAVKVQPVSAAQTQAALAWRGKRVEFSDTPLAEALVLFNLRNKIQLSLENRANGARTISGIFWSDDPAGFARLLEISLGLVMARDGDAIVLRDR